MDQHYIEPAADVGLNHGEESWLLNGQLGCQPGDDVEGLIALIAI